MHPGGIRHEAFFAALGKTSEDSERWPALLAALVTLRLIDEWLASRLVPAEMLAAVQTTLHTVPADDPSRRLVGDLLTPIAQCDVPDFRAVAAPLMAYADWMKDSAHWALADDVYTAVWHGLMKRMPLANADIDLACRAALLAGACRRGSGEAAAADEAYAAAYDLAKRLNDPFRMLKGELGRAKVVRQRGNLPAAEAAFRDLIRRASDRSLMAVRAEAYHELGVTLFWRGEHDQAIAAYHQGWSETEAPSERLRILVDIGSVLGELGYIEQARIADLLVLEIAKDDVTLHGVACINLMELARLDYNELEFTRYRTRVERELSELPKKIQVDYHYGVGLGLETFGDTERALQQYDRAIEIAESHGLGQELYRVDCARDTIVDGLSNVVPWDPPPKLLAVDRVGQALARELQRVAAH